MEYLDPKKHKAHLVRLTIGYILIGTALLLTAVILLYRAYGFGLKNGEVIQNGLVFISSRPAPADLHVNGKKLAETTNARLLLPAGQYAFELQRNGYRPWKRAINIEGGSVARFDYPVLFPTTLTTETVKRYDTRPGLVTESPDRRWLMVQSTATHTTFDVYDLNKDESEIAAVGLTLPESLFTLTDGTHQWQLVEWSNDNRHVLLQHRVEKDGKQSSEYILADREKPEASVNLTKALGSTPVKLLLRDKKYDQYFVYDQNGTLSTASLEKPQPVTLVEKVLDFKTHGSNVILYATTASEDKVAVKLLEGDRSYTIRQVAKSDHYSLDLARYEDAWYIVAGASSENRTYVYKNPAGTLHEAPDAPLVPVHVLKAPNATYVAFSDNTRFIMTQGGQQFAVYDAENDKGYAYTMQAPVDAPQKHAEWMDGHRLMYVSEGKTVVFDFDNANREVLSGADANFSPLFDRDFRNLFTVTSQVTKAADSTESLQFSLTRTALLTPEDQ